MLKVQSSDFSTSRLKRISRYFMFSLIDVLSKLVKNITTKFIHGQTVDQFRDCVKLGCALGYAFGKVLIDWLKYSHFSLKSSGLFLFSLA